MENEENVAEATFNKLYFHKKYRQYKIGRFHFKKGHLRITTAADDEEFLKLVNAQGFPKREAVLIVEVNETAKANAEKSVIRGSMGADDILTAKDKQRLTALSNPNAAGNNLAPAGVKPSGMNLAGFSLDKK